MAADKRADIVAWLPGMKLPIELKRDKHPEVWNSIQDQLERFYTRDPESLGFGIYAVLWFGKNHLHLIPKPPTPLKSPASADEMERQLRTLVPAERQNRIAVIVLDVSAEIPD